jgi:hypothetical protein
METNSTPLSELRVVAATLYALSNLAELSELGCGNETVTMYDLNAEERSEVPALSITLVDLADGVMDRAYGDEGWSDDENEAVEERAELLYSLLDTEVPAIMDTIRIASMEEALRKQRRDEAA